MDEVRKSIKEYGRNPSRFNAILIRAMQRLKYVRNRFRDEINSAGAELKDDLLQLNENRLEMQKPLTPEKPEEAELSKNFNKYYAIHKKLEDTDKKIQKNEKKVEDLKKEMSNCKGLFKRKKIDNLAGEIADEYVKMSKQRALLGRIAVKAGFGSVEEFYKKYEASKSSHNEYIKTLKEWENKYGKTDDAKAKNKPASSGDVSVSPVPFIKGILG